MAWKETKNIFLKKCPYCKAKPVFFFETESKHYSVDCVNAKCTRLPLVRCNKSWIKTTFRWNFNKTVNRK